MTLSDLLPWLGLLALTWFWFDSMRAKEAAVAAARRACEAESRQLLDETVALRKLWPARDDEGVLRLKRVYEFEYSEYGNDRHGGLIVMLHQHVVAVQFDARANIRSLH